jgi:hypothetical protein
MNKSKTKLQDIVKILSVDTDQLDNYLTPNQSLNKKCSAITMGDVSKENLIKYNSEICFIVESLKPHAEDHLILLDIEKPEDRIEMSITDFVENGTRPEEMWKLAESKPYYEYFGYVSKGEDVDSLVGFMCYDKQSNPNILKVSNIIWADNDIGTNQELRNKLYDILDNELTGKSLQSKLFIPEQLDEKVNAEFYTKGETKDGFTMWEVIMPPKPSEMEIKIKTETNPKAVMLLEFLQKISLLFKEKSKSSAVSPEDVKVDVQTGGADNALLDEIIIKYPSLKGLKSMIGDLPEDIQQKYASDITKTLEELKESNVEETKLMDEPEFQEIQADLNAQIIDKATEGETPTDTTTSESKEGETPTDTPPTDTPPTDTTASETTASETTASEPANLSDTSTTTASDTTASDTTASDTTASETTASETTASEPANPSTTTTVVESTSSETANPTATTVVTPTTPNAVEPTTTTDTANTTATTVVTPTTTVESTTSASTDTAVVEPSTITTVESAAGKSDDVTLKREDLKESPLLVQPTTGESGKYIFVPKDLVEKAIDFLLNNGCEVTTVNLK